MKKILFALCLLFTLGISVATAQNHLTNPGTPKTGAVAHWDKTTHDFTEIPQGVPVTTTFKFTNTGNSPIVIAEVKVSCGCTTPSYSKEPIMPGKTGFVKAQFNAANDGTFTKSITVISNATEPQKMLYIKGMVIKGE